MERRGTQPLRGRWIVVPLDGSDDATRALPVARRLGAVLGSELSVVHVAQPDAADEDVRRAVGESGAHVVTDHDVAGAILHAAESRPGAILCMASHGRGRSAGVLGSVAADVVARAMHPVVLVGPNTVDPYVAEGDVVSCVDGSEESEASLAPAAAWASVLGSAMKIVTVIEPAPIPVVPGVTPHPWHWPASVAEDYVSRLARDWRNDGARVDCEVIGDPVSVVDGISEYVAAQPAALVAVATHQRTGLARVMISSVAAGVVRRSAAPVLVVPAPS